MVLGLEVASYRDRHGKISQNVLVACNFDLEFVYILSGWEGSAHDSKLLHDAVSRRNGLKVPEGKFFLVDCGFANRRQILALFQGVRYHLQDFAGLHNFLRKECCSDEFPIGLEDDESEDEENDDELGNQTQEQQRQIANAWRAGIATNMWTDVVSDSIQR
ncbi:uncharacterized protein LOC103964470 [Pyrus x bretschneideri]|uniref:uncharacterized protein LOC103964470 n=1 Tax=Pyrus x bretschneideri TaxID=225117 RepID=UPI00202E0E51|nr:uncharacterized protein LOC103964470 [Pyrus x bretschneideri]